MGDIKQKICYRPLKMSFKGDQEIRNIHTYREPKLLALKEMKHVGFL